MSISTFFDEKLKKNEYFLEYFSDNAGFLGYKYIAIEYLRILKTIYI